MSCLKAPRSRRVSLLCSNTEVCSPRAAGPHGQHSTHRQQAARGTHARAAKTGTKGKVWWEHISSRERNEEGEKRRTSKEQCALCKERETEILEQEAARTAHTHRDRQREREKEKTKAQQ